MRGRVQHRRDPHTGEVAESVAAQIVDGVAKVGQRAQVLPYLRSAPEHDVVRLLPAHDLTRAFALHDARRARTDQSGIDAKRAQRARLGADLDLRHEHVRFRLRMGHTTQLTELAR